MMACSCSMLRIFVGTSAMRPRVNIDRPMRAHLQHRQRLVEQVEAAGQAELEAPAVLVHQVGEGLGQGRGVGVLGQPVADRQPLQAVHDVGDGDLCGQRRGAEVARNAAPHGVRREHLAPLVGVDHGEQGPRGVLHVGPVGARAAATAALQAMDDPLAARRGLDHLAEERRSRRVCFAVSIMDVLQTGRITAISRLLSTMPSPARCGRPARRWSAHPARPGRRWRRAARPGS